MNEFDVLLEMNLHFEIRQVFVLENVQNIIGVKVEIIIGFLVDILIDFFVSLKIKLKIIKQKYLTDFLILRSQTGENSQIFRHLIIENVS